jgi:hypothetical protein
MTTLKRMWINQPSKRQPLNKLHATNVLATSEIRQNTVIIYFLEGDTISQECSLNCLSEGWVEHQERW